MNKIFIILLIFIFLLFPLPVFADTELRGYYKNLLLKDEDKFLGANRLRLQFLINFSPELKGDIQYTNQLSFGDILFNTSMQEPDYSFFKTDKKLLAQDNLDWKHSFYRAYVSFNISSIDFVIGRQRVAWGTGRFWNPTDILNPYDPLDIESSERPGVDAALLKINLSRLSALSLVGALNKDISTTSIASRYHATIGNNDISMMIGKFKEDMVIGADYAGSFKGAGIRAESTYTLAKNEEPYWKFVLSTDYAFPRLYVLGEYYYNGQGSRNKLFYNMQKLLKGEMLNLAQNYLGLLLSYDIHPLLKLNFQMIYNLDDLSYFFSPSILYSVSSNIDFITGLNRFAGEENSEYGKNSTLLYSQLQWSF